MAHTGHYSHHHRRGFAARTPGHPDAADGRGGPIDWNDLLPRQIVGVCGGFVTAIGLAAAVLAGPAGFLSVAGIGAAIAVVGFAADIVAAIRDAAAGVTGAGSHEPQGRARPDPRR
jgi:hypothetical protein